MYFSLKVKRKKKLIHKKIVVINFKDLLHSETP